MFVNQSNNCFTNFYILKLRVGGYFMVVNGSQGFFYSLQQFMMSEDYVMVFNGLTRID
jgi:hypothetical protein